MTTDGLITASPRPAIVRQTLAILHDAYRELNSRKLFWIVLVLSGLAMAAFGLIKVYPDRLTLAGYHWETGFIPPVSLYKLVFSSVVIDYWLTWAATILAIISTAGIFPDFLSAGSIDLFISKPISRLRLFLTKYLAGLLFVFLQVLVFSVMAYIVMGVRGGLWEPRVFLAIPVVLCFFSYLFAISALFGVLTRSTVATFLLTILVWAMAFCIYFAEIRLLAYSNLVERRIAVIDRELAQIESGKPTTRLRGAGSVLTSAADMLGMNPRRAELLKRRENDLNNLKSLQRWHRIAAPLHAIMPKTTETTDLLARWLISPDEFLAFMENKRANLPEEYRRDVSDQDLLFLDDEVERIKRSRSSVYVIASSLLFETAVLGLAAWLFCRRDF